ncbi:hypothetical protein JG687_00003775 [Phytophthora cactorum]|uniref:PX domain-containing protein n=1 Tax=Phytophthora cactorum TaxID=29920 RepID=A0A329SV11_9STRA|nr:hypothetical protein Pcac1_g2155 [Phytophthora cactorum]KAG2826914.1 hypothetical protein PC112_g9070 [Phytophthora cactorum]KAG2828717.1 hypothetical protein PC111_g8049 [Phytophthora cactorum]KAG2858726.1 hypothetical protein PC113_g9540 [Phytophthora cactorum]KAG2909563.1 hypothetical protein PC114_g10080 [Phytophthora cactorum]
MTAVTTPNAEEASTSATNRARHKELLSFAREMPKLKPLPALTSASLAPLSSAPRDRSPPSSMEFLSNLDQIRIVDTQTSTHDGATLYVVESYTLSYSYSTSNIPTQLRPPLSSVSQLSTATPTTASTSEHEAPEREPDLCVRRRFSDFARLRHEAVAASCVNAHFLCQYCRQLRTYTRFHAAQPLWFVRVVSTKKQRKKILARFLSDFVDFAQSRAQRDRHCRLRQTLPKLIEEFLSE